ncbi:MAG: hypothetical protein HPY82_03135 [Gammaproteobacteria bacterium]|nr:hypothetical protein [Gammaproteobacteria bacterium]
MEERTNQRVSRRKKMSCYFCKAIFNPENRGQIFFGEGQVVWRIKRAEKGRDE